MQYLPCYKTMATGQFGDQTIGGISIRNRDKLNTESLEEFRVLCELWYCRQGNAKYIAYRQFINQKNLSSPIKL